jgi:hypothetical protein
LEEAMELASMESSTSRHSDSPSDPGFSETAMDEDEVVVSLWFCGWS